MDPLTTILLVAALPVGIIVGTKVRRGRVLAAWMGRQRFRRDENRYTGEFKGVQFRLEAGPDLKIRASFPGPSPVSGSIQAGHGYTTSENRTGDATFDGNFDVDQIELRACLDASARAAMPEVIRDGVTYLDGALALTVAMPARSVELEAPMQRLVDGVRTLEATGLCAAGQLEGRLLALAINDPVEGVAAHAIESLGKIWKSDGDADAVRRVLSESAHDSVKLAAATLMGAQAADSVRPLAQSGDQRAQAIIWFGRFAHGDGAELGALVEAALSDGVDPLSCAEAFDFYWRAQGEWAKPDKAQTATLLERSAQAGLISLEAARTGWRGLLARDDVHTIAAAKLLGAHGLPEDAQALHRHLQMSPPNRIRKALQAALAELTQADAGQLAVADASNGALALSDEI